MSAGIPYRRKTPTVQAYHVTTKDDIPNVVKMVVENKETGDCMFTLDSTFPTAAWYFFPAWIIVFDNGLTEVYTEEQFANTYEEIK